LKRLKKIYLSWCKKLF